MLFCYNLDLIFSIFITKIFIRNHLISLIQVILFKFEFALLAKKVLKFECSFFFTENNVEDLSILIIYLIFNLLKLSWWWIIECHFSNRSFIYSMLIKIYQLELVICEILQKSAQQFRCQFLFYLFISQFLRTFNFDFIIDKILNLWHLVQPGTFLL